MTEMNKIDIKIKVYKINKISKFIPFKALQLKTSTLKHKYKAKIILTELNEAFSLFMTELIKCNMRNKESCSYMN